MPTQWWSKDRLLAFVIGIAVRGMLLITLGLTISCGVASATRSMFGGSLPFNVTIAPDANENSAVAVDLVVVYDSKLVEQLLKKKAADWFKEKEQFLKDHPNQVDIHPWEWVPSQGVGELTVPYRAGARKVLLFADYSTDGDHRWVVDPQQRFNLLLGNVDFTVELTQ
jgi:type VI secretion system protein